MKHLILISALLLVASNCWAEETGLTCRLDGYDPLKHSGLLGPLNDAYYVLDIDQEYIEEFDTQSMKWLKHELEVELKYVNWGYPSPFNKDFGLDQYEHHILDRETLKLKIYLIRPEKTMLAIDGRLNCKLDKVSLVRKYADILFREATKNRKF